MESANEGTAQDDVNMLSSDDTDDNTSDEESPDPETELMVTSRTRRTTAGNRYNNVVAQEQAEQDEQDDVALLFAEMEGEDDEYHSDEGADDADMSSSDDDDDRGPNAAPDDLDGEKALQTQEKAERAKKRKADLALTTTSAIRKKPRIDPTSLRRAPVSKPTKRKERVSWLPEVGLAPGRTSLRKQTIAHRAETHAKLKENEKQRLKAKAVRAQKVKERAADAPKALTQADRLAEADRVEKRNAKSLNRWEESEKKRAEEQAAKLAALKDRKLAGPVVTVHSARHVYAGWRSKEVLDGEVVEVKKRGRKSKAYLEQLAAAKAKEDALLMQPPEASQDSLVIRDPLPRSTLAPSSTSTPSKPVENSTQGSPNPPHSTDMPQATSFLSGIHEYASAETGSTGSQVPTTTTTLESDPLASSLNSVAEPRSELKPDSDVPPDPLPASAQTEVVSSQKELVKIETPQTTELKVVAEPPDLVEAGSGIGVASDALKDSNISGATEANQARQTALAPEVPGALPTPTRMENKPEPDTLMSGTDSGAREVVPADGDQAESITITADAAPPDQTIPRPEVAAVVPAAPDVVSTRNLVVLEKFDELSAPDRHEFGVFYGSRKAIKPTKHTAELCLITGLPVRYRDPVTSLGYHNAAAFKEIQAVRRYRYAWSSMLGCYVGRGDRAARGVPDGFGG